MEGFLTPPDHINFLAKRLFGDVGKIIDGSIAYLEPNGGGPIKLHTHIHSHLFIVINGQARIILDKEEKILNPNEAFVVAGNIPHSVWNNIASTTTIIGISIIDKTL